MNAKKTYFEIPGVRDFYSDQIGVVEVDPEILETIRLLNFKGYKTIASCAGHHQRGRISYGYIWLKPCPNSNLPKNVQFCDKLNATCFRWGGKGSCKTLIDLQRLWIDLENWARSLPVVS